MPTTYVVDNKGSGADSQMSDVSRVHGVNMLRRRSSVAIPQPPIDLTAQTETSPSNKAKTPEKKNFFSNIIPSIHNPFNSKSKKDTESKDKEASGPAVVYHGNGRSGSIATSEKGIEKGEDDNKDENKERGNWSSEIDCMLSLLGYTVGLGTVWRFPFLCYQYGGGAFIFAYLIALIIIGIPLFYLELAIGQFTSRGPLGCWEYSPIFKGLGIAQLFISFEVSIYYNVVLGWAAFYLFSSFTSNLPWKTCDNWWNSDLCLDKIPDVLCNGSIYETMQPNGTCTNGTQVIGVWNDTLFGVKRPSASEEYFYRRMLRISDGILTPGPVWWDLALCLLFVWVICFFSMLGGIKTSGKVIWVTTIVPYVILVIMFGRAVSLPNASEGLTFYIKPDFTKLRDVTVWSTAAVQMFYTLCNCWGGLIVLSSYSKFNTNLYRNTLAITIFNFFTGIFVGCIVFGFLGFLAGYKGVGVDQVADAGPALAFVVFPEAVSKLVGAPFFSVLFYLILLTFGLSSEFTIVQTSFTSILDKFAVLRPHMKKVILFVSVLSFLLGLTMCTSGGSFLMNLMDSYICGWNLLLMGIIECVSVTWVYGVQRFSKDIKVMLGWEPGPWWKVCWMFLSPAFLGFNLIVQWIYYAPPTFHNVPYPFSIEVMGWLMSLSSIIWVPVIAVVLMIVEREESVWQTFKKIVRPSKYWGPALPQHRALVDYVENFDVDPWNKQTQATSGIEIMPSVMTGRPSIQMETNLTTDSVMWVDNEAKKQNNNNDDNNNNDRNGYHNQAYSNDDHI